MTVPRRAVRALLPALVLGWTAWLAVPAGADEVTAGTVRASVSTDGKEGNGTSFRPTMSAEGRYVAFDSDSRALVPGDTNGVRDVFVVDRTTGTVERTSLGPKGIQANDDSQRPWLSADGQRVAFWSLASNLVAGDTNGVADAFVYDRTTKTTTRVSVASDDTQGDGASLRPVISGDGRFVAFESDATGLVPDDTNGTTDIFRHDLVAGTTTRMSVGSRDDQGNGASERPSISGDGQRVAFHSAATNLLTTDVNGKSRDVFVRDVAAEKTILVSADGAGEQGKQGSLSPSISADGRFVAFDSNAPNLTSGDEGRTGDVFVRDLLDETTTMVSVSNVGLRGDGESFDPSIAGDGHRVAFWSGATNLVAGDTNQAHDIFFYDLFTGSTTRVSVSSAGEQADGPSFSPGLSADGKWVAFDSKATNLVPGDANSASDVFVHAE